jgi:glycosyltransferase involved in cell wall biosynthesis
VIREKGIELMVEAVAEADLTKQYEILVRGPIEDQHYAIELQRKAKRAGVTLQLTGPVDREDVIGVLSGTHLVALTSEFESWGQVACEAIQAGTPVLVTDTCGVASDLSSAEAMIVPRQVESIREALRELAADDFSKLRKLRTSCRSAPLATREADVLRVLEQAHRSTIAPRM